MKTIIAAAAAALILGACGGGGDDDASEELANVTYTVTNTTGAEQMVTYETSSGVAQVIGPTPFSFSRSARSGDFLYVSGQNFSNLAFGQITATIRVNGALFKTTTSTGPGAIATATGACC